MGRQPLRDIVIDMNRKRSFGLPLNLLKTIPYSTTSSVVQQSKDKFNNSMDKKLQLLSVKLECDTDSESSDESRVPKLVRRSGRPNRPGVPTDNSDAGGYDTDYETVAEYTSNPVSASGNTSKVPTQPVGPVPRARYTRGSNDKRDGVEYYF
jgi:hypothetical protein